MNTIVTDQNFDREVLKSAGPVLLEIGAEWCGTCHIMAPVLEKLSARFHGRLKICQLDIDQSSEVPARYGVRVTPTLLVFDGGLVAYRFTGAVSRTALESCLADVCQKDVSSDGDPTGSTRRADERLEADRKEPL